MLLSELLDLEELDQAIADKYIRVQKHPTLPLKIMNYSESCVYSKAWNDSTLNSRGLILTEEGDIVGRAFPKFFNFEEPQFKIQPSGTAIVMPKFDGSLGILTKYNDQLVFATRGSFQSTQAQWFEKFFTKHPNFFTPLDGYTYLWEICGRFNRIVVDYPEDRLVLLDVIDNRTGASALDIFDSVPWPDKVEKRLVMLDANGDVLYKELEDFPDDEEGIVVYWPSTNTRCKLKKTRYVQLHKLFTRTSARTVWEVMSSGRPFTDLLEDTPDELYDFITKEARKLQESYTHILSEATDAYLRYKNSTDNRKDFALKAKNHTYSDVIFLLMDNKDVSLQIWKRIKPAADKPFLSQSEAVA